MKTINLTILFLFFPLIFFAQSLTGLWTGTLTNDSNTIRRDQSFEIVLTQYKDKVYGYSRMTFFVHDSLYYIVKRVKGTVEEDLCEVKDDDIISHNFPRKPDKGVKLVSTFRRNKQDSTWRLDGDWKTTENKRYYSVSGKISLKTEPDIEKSKLIPHLEELNLADDVAFYKQSKKASEPVAITTQPAKNNKTEQAARTDNPVVSSIKETKTADVSQTKPATPGLKKETPVTEEKPLVVSLKDNKKDNPVIVSAKPEQVAQTKQPVNIAQKEQPTTEEKIVITVAAKNNKKDSVTIAQVRASPAREINQPVNTNKKDVTIKEKVPEKQEPKKSEPIVITKPVEQKKEPVIEQSKPETKNSEFVSATVVTKESDKQQPVTTFSEAKPVIPTAAVFVAERKVAPPQVVNFKSDSLELALYDNGEVDGDTVSVLVNGEIILAKQGLKTSAIKKTIYTGKNDSLTMVLYAENLGKYPPNTGLLIVHDGEETYQIRFSADLQQNAAVIFKRRKN